MEVLRNCLRGYAHGCLTAFLPSLSSTQFSSTSILQTLMRFPLHYLLTIIQISSGILKILNCNLIRFNLVLAVPNFY